MKGCLKAMDNLVELFKMWHTSMTECKEKKKAYNIEAGAPIIDDQAKLKEVMKEKYFRNLGKLAMIREVKRVISIETRTGSKAARLTFADAVKAPRINIPKAGGAPVNRNNVVLVYPERSQSGVPAMSSKRQRRRSPSWLTRWTTLLGLRTFVKLETGVSWWRLLIRRGLTKLGKTPSLGNRVSRL